MTKTMGGAKKSMPYTELGGAPGAKPPKGGKPKPPKGK